VFTPGSSGMLLRVDRRDPDYSAQYIASIFAIDDFNPHEKPKSKVLSKIRELLLWSQA
jgi:hypothetical protein